MAFIYRWLADNYLFPLETILNKPWTLAERSGTELPAGIAGLEGRLDKLLQDYDTVLQREWLIADFALDLILTLNENADIIAISPSCFRQLGYASEALCGRSLFYFLPEKVRSLLSNKNEPNALSQMELHWKTRSDELKCFRLSVEWSENSKLFFCTALDVTLEKRLEKAKEEFIAMVSHDLKTPVASIGSYLDVLASGAYGPLTDKGKQMLTVSQDSLARLLRLTSDLLDLDKLECGQIVLDMKELNVEELVENAIQSVENFADASNVEITLAECSKSLKVEGDADRLIQVLINLLSNAVKFSPAKSVVEVKIIDLRHSVEFQVIDQGRGVPQDFLAHVFERYKQFSLSDSKDKKGAGLGLAIVKGLVEAHKGQVGVNSVTGEGSTFWFRLAKKMRI